MFILFCFCYCTIGGLLHSNVEAARECTYTFTANEASLKCPDSAAVTKLRKTVNSQASKLTQLTEQVEMLKRIKNNGQCGSTYVRWGSNSCPSTATLVYEGYTAGKWFTHKGGGVNYQCLPKTPDFSPLDTMGNPFYKHISLIYGTEYQTSNIKSPFIPLLKDNHNVPCAVCEVSRCKILMVPAKTSCPSGWTVEYEGILVAQAAVYSDSTFECVDKAMDEAKGGIGNENGALFYSVAAVCGSLPCPPYKDYYQLRCVVCSK